MTIDLPAKWMLQLTAVSLMAFFAANQNTARAADAPSTEILMARALRAYQANDYPAALELFSEIIQASPSYRPALFYRGLVHGELATQHQRQSWLAPQGSAARASEIRQYREEYRLMAADMDRLMAKVTDSDSIVRLLDAVTALKLAGPPSPPPTATAPDEPERRSDPAAAAALLDKAIQALDAYLHPGLGMKKPAELNRVRAELFLGIAHYRRALVTDVSASTQPGRATGSPSDVALQHLKQAKETFSSLSNVESPNRIELLLPGSQAQLASDRARWRSYAEFYLGQVNVELANRSGSDLNAYRQYLQEAVTSYSSAREQNALVAPRLRSTAIDETADLMIGKPGQEGGGEIGKVMSQVGTAKAKPYQDFRLDWFSGFIYDTNVPLLGGNTGLPYELGKKQDFRFTTGVSLSYTGSLAALTGIENEELDRWELGFNGRASSGWNASIHEYNEQDYGGSVALQYRVLNQETSGAKHGPLYLGVQYDYDYFLLGNNGYLRSNRVTPRMILYTFDRHAVTSLGFTYEDRNYLEPLYDKQFDRDGNYYYLSLTQSVELLDMTKFYCDHGIQPWGMANDPHPGAPELYQFGRYDPEGYEYRRYLKPYIGTEIGWDETQGSEYDDRHIALVAGINVPLPYGLLFDFRGQWEWQDYTSHSLVDYHRRGREDFIQRYGFGLERSFVLVRGNADSFGTLKMDRVLLTIRGDIYFTDDDSNVVDRLNQAVYSYDRAIYGLSFVLSFN